MTNYEKIKSMSIDEMAEFIAEVQTNALCLTGNTVKKLFITAWKNILKARLKKNDTGRSN